MQVTIGDINIKTTANGSAYFDTSIQMGDGEMPTTGLHKLK